MSAIKDTHEPPPSVDPFSAVTHPFSKFKTADQFSAIRERLAAVAADLREAARRDVQPDNKLLEIAEQLEITATEGKPR